MIEDIETSVTRLNASLKTQSLPHEVLEQIAKTADTDTTLMELAERDQLVFPGIKEERYAMFVLFANAFWNTVKDISIQVESESDTAGITIHAGERTNALHTLSHDCDTSSLPLIQRAVSEAYADAMSKALRECRNSHRDLHKISGTAVKES